MQLLYCLISMLLPLSAIAATNAKWEVVDFGDFSYRIPPQLTQYQFNGSDSLAAAYNSKDLQLTFDYGWYSNSFQDWSQGTKYESLVVDGRKARIGTVHEDFGFRRPWSTQIHFSRIWPDDVMGKPLKLSIFASCETEADVAMARQIFRSIRFKKRRRSK